MTRSSSSPWPRAAEIALAFLALLPETRAISFQSAPSPNLDLSELGRVALAGSFDSISLFEYLGQSEAGSSTNGSQSIYSQYPTGQFATLDSSDASILAMCPFVAMDGTLNGIVVGGNFTSFGNQESQGAALLNPLTGAVTPLSGLNGQIAAVFCDNSAQTVYVGGTFQGANSTNAIAWVNGWTNLPFAGFNGPVTSIAQLSNGNIVFGGQFTQIGNITSAENIVPMTPQVVNVGSANITSSGQSSNPSYNNPSSIICTTPGQISPNSSFLLQEHAPGSITANFGFGFTPSVLRLLNTQVSGWGTQTWRYTAFPINGIMNFTYYNAAGVLQSCTSECPLAQNSSYQDFYFVNPVGQNSFRFDISAWYGQGGGLGGIELFQNAIWAYAVDNFNTPACDGVSNSGASATTTGPWTVAPSGDSYSEYLTVTLPQGTGTTTDTSVVFLPKIQTSGNYSINMWTPGCLQDNTCASRGQVNITGNVGSPTGTSAQPFTTTLYQTNDYLKYDQIYYGYIEAASGNYRPSITLTPNLNQNGPLTVIAESLGINLTAAFGSSGSSSSSSSGETTGSLNGLFEFNPNEVQISGNYSNSTIDYAGSVLNENAYIMALTMIDDSLYAAGSFSTDTFENIMVVQNGNATDLGHGGLNQPVQSMYFVNGTIYVGGNFTNTKDNSVSGLNNVAAYTVSSNSWSPLGAGLNGMVYDVVPISLNVSGILQQAIAFSGHFKQINAFGSNSSASVSDLAIWIPSLNNWLENLNVQSVALSGRLTASTDVPNSTTIYAGSINSQMLSAKGAVGVNYNSGLSLQKYPINFVTSNSSTSMTKVKRDAPQGDINGVVTGLFYDSNGLNLTITGGHFTALASNGSQISNLAIINGTNDNQVTGLPYNSTAAASVLALESSGTTLYIGGSFADGILFYDLVAAQPSSVQPPGVSGMRGTVYSIAMQPSTSLLFVGGSFTSAGSLGCPGLCVYDTSLQQWQSAPSALSGQSTITFLQWASNNRLLLAGNMTINGAQTTMAVYDSKSSTLTAVPNANTLPGPITSFTAIDNSFTTAFAAGTSTTNSSAYLSYFDGNSNWISISGLGPLTTIQGLQTLGLSSSHASSTTLDSAQSLLVMGQLDLPDYGNVSAALFDGKTFIPLVLSSMSDGTPGSIYGAFVQNPQNLLNSTNNHLALGFVVLIGLACALGAVFLLVVLGILVERIRRRREGYVPAPTGALMFEKSGGNVGNISPQRLFGGVGSGTTGDLRL